MPVLFLLLLLLLPLPLSVHAKDFGELSANPAGLSGWSGLSGLSGLYGSQVDLPVRPKRQTSQTR
jgi:hypothetical protein